EYINDRRVAKFMDQISAALNDADLEPFRQLVTRYESEHNVPASDIAAALAHLWQGEQPLLLKARHDKETTSEPPAGRVAKRRERDGDAPEKRPRREMTADAGSEPGMERFRVEVGHEHDVKPGNIVGA